MQRGVNALKKVLLALVVLLVVASATSTPLMAKDYTFPKVEIFVQIHEDGSFTVTEKRTYKFDGSFTWATYELPKKGFKALQGFSVADEKGTYQKTDSEAYQPGTFTFIETDNSYLCKFFYSASDTIKTFTFKYTVKGGMNVYTDVADFYWKLIGTGWDKPTGFLTATIALPKAVPEQDLYVFGHGPLQGIVTRSATAAYYTVRNVPARTYVEARVVFPSWAVSLAPVTPTQMKEAILAEERAWAEQTERQLRQQRIALIGLVAALLMVFAGWLYMYRKYGVEYVPQQRVDYTRDIDADVPPAYVGFLMRFGSVTGEDFAATLLNLVRKGYLRLDVEGKNAYLSPTEKKESSLLTHEALVYRLITEEIPAYMGIGEGDKVSLKDVERFNKRYAKAAASAFQEFQRQVGEEAKKLGYFEPMPGAVVAYLVLSFIVLMGGIIASVRWNLEPMVVPYILGIILLAVGGIYALRRRSKTGAEAYQYWNGLRKFIRDFTNMRESEPLALTLWEQYLVYATTFGLAKKVLRKFKQFVKEYPPSSAELASSHMFYALAVGEGQNLGAITSVVDSFVATVSSFTTSVSTGSGGGFSGGGGGGGGGSGGGAG